MQAPSYDTYYADKGWGAEPTESHFWYFDALHRQLRLPARARVLDVGFGDGRLLDWCRARGHEAQGVEIQPQAIGRARERGHRVHEGLLARDTFGEGATFDVIVLFDVAEHLTHERLQDYLGIAASLLAPGGVVVLRFPNAASPFAAPLQHGDLTHIAWVSPAIVEALAPRAGLRVLAAVSDRLMPPGLGKRLRRSLAFGLRNLIESAIGYAYFGRRIPLDPNVLMVLGR